MEGKKISYLCDSQHSKKMYSLENRLRSCLAVVKTSKQNVGMHKKCGKLEDVREINTDIFIWRQV